ncbi:MAG: CHAD domain-containing protein [Lentisphaeria bacterium]
MAASRHHRADTPGHRLAVLVRGRLHVLRRELRILTVGAGADAETVHRLRVAARRLRNALALARLWSGRRRFRRLSRRLGRISRAFGALRDLDVQAQFIDRLARREERCLRPVFRRLARRLRGRRRRRASGLAGLLPAAQSLCRQIGAAADRLAAAGPGPAAGKVWQNMLARSVRRRWETYRVAADIAMTAPDAGALHRWRIATKKLRYRLEALTPAGAVARFAPQIARLAELQGHLGDVHDAAVFAAMLAPLAREEAAASRRRPLPWLKLGGRRALARNAARRRRALHAAVQLTGASWLT